MKRIGKKRGKLEQQNAAYLLIAPSYLIYLFFVLIPVIWTIAMSFTDYNLSKAHFVGISNYIQLTKDPIFIKSVGNTLFYCLLAIVPAMLLGLALAMFLNQKLKGKGFRSFVKQGQKVHVGERIIRVDSYDMKNKGIDLTTMILFPSADKKIAVKKEGYADQGKTIVASYSV